MKDLAISPLRFWHKHLNPNREPEEPCISMQLGSAVHCAVLEPTEFLKRYARAVDAQDYEGCLVTVGDMREWLNDRGVKPKGTKKDEVIAQVRLHSRDVPIFQEIEDAFETEHAGKVVFKPEDWLRIQRMADCLRSEPKLQEILADGQAEVPFFVTDPETGVPLKAKLDWLTPKPIIFDGKTFSHKRDKSIDKTVADAIWYECYYRQYYVYCYVWAIKNGAKVYEAPDYVMGFVESEEPHETRIKVLRPKRAGEPNLYFERARVEVREYIRTYAEYLDHFGPDKPWRYAQDIELLGDEDLPGLSY
jgi:PDDEXK-like domain of unknown function (DUF3799)